MGASMCIIQARRREKYTKSGQVVNISGLNIKHPAVCMRISENRMQATG